MPVSIRFNYDAHAKFEVVQPTRCRLLAFLLLIRCVMLWPWSLTFDLEHCAMVKLCTKFERSRAICGGVIAIWVFDLMTLNTYRMLRYAQDSLQLHEVQTEPSYRFTKWKDYCLRLIRYVTLWPWPLTFDLEHLQCVGCAIVKLCTKFERNRAIRGGVITVCIFDLMTLNMYRVLHIYALVWYQLVCTKFKLTQDWLIDWLIDWLSKA